MIAEPDAQAALRARQGPGARYDAANAPAEDLAFARRGTAYFARLLNDLSSTGLDAPSRIPGWSRRHVIAHVSYNARSFARLIHGVRTNAPEAAYPSTADRQAEINFGATLPDRALRHLFQHSEVHLNVEWRDLGDADWDSKVTDLTGAPLVLRNTPWLRARELWLHAIDLDAGGRFRDMPPGFIDRLAVETPRNGQLGEDAASSLQIVRARHDHGRLPYGSAARGTAPLPEDWPY